MMRSLLCGFFATMLLLGSASAWTAPVSSSSRPQALGATRERFDARTMSEVMAREHEKTLEMLAAARGEVVAEYAPRIADLEAEVRLAAKLGRALTTATTPPPKEEPKAAAVAAPTQELHFLEYDDVPLHVHGKKEPLEATVLSVKRAIGADAPGEICHVVLDSKGKLPYVEGQSVGILPPGVDAAKGKPHTQRLYSIASSRYGDDGAGTSVSLCVRRAVFVDTETNEEDPSKKGVCSNFLCDASPGASVQLTGPTGKSMLLPVDDDAADVIMVATGTGVAPFRGFVNRLFLERTPAAAAFEGTAWLFLGVPTSSSLLYPEEFERAKALRPDQFKLTYAISREETNPVTNEPGSKCYVQHRLHQYADDIFHRLEHNGAHIYFCGLKGMMPGIEDTLKLACQQRGIDFTTWMKQLKKDKRWHVEVY